MTDSIKNGIILKEIERGVTAPEGFLATGVQCGIKYESRNDLALIYSECRAAAAAVYTTNRVYAAPITVCRKHLKDGVLQAAVVNSGIANACTGKQGLKDAKRMTALTGEALQISGDLVAVASTGVIGWMLPMERIETGIKKAAACLSADGGDAASQAIMTTDTHPKTFAVEYKENGTMIRVGGMAKGSGMIRPNMATLLSFITTDASIDAELLHCALVDSVERSFNAITVDGDMSTNDMVLVMANGKSGAEKITDKQAAYELFCNALKHVCVELARMLVMDGEGATKFIEVRVEGAATDHEAKIVAMSVANSMLTKAAFFGEDPNWGRIVCAVGYSGVPVVPDKMKVFIGGYLLFENGMPAKYDEALLQRELSGREFEVTIQLGMGNESFTAYTQDLSYEYVRINAEYTT